MTNWTSSPARPSETGTVAWNLFDIDSKFGDVELHSNVTEYLNHLPKFDETTTP
ncbi:hypothetical protein [Arthrobacter livingstonensis]|uniref:hypothetical protein n=1 Tax=Arthrobacter livingstonensis TaxID=670078 RepID=UPI001B865392|nr:hypothetical protein [Arthrobacter livingstonensis]